ncbi:MAG: flavin reductase family protein [Aggregatilineales bacterium]
MEINPEALSHQQVYKLLVGAIVPRAIAWVSSLNPEGACNLAPFSFFTAVCPRPPTLVFAPMIRGTDGAEKDTLRNIRDTGEFVVNVVTEMTVVAANISSTEFPAEVDEFVAAHVTPAPSIVVKPPRVLESPVNFECRLRQIVPISDEPGGGSLIIGTIVYIHVRDDLLRGDYRIDPDALRAVGRMAGADYSRITDRFALERPPSQIQKRPVKP